MLRQQGVQQGHGAAEDVEGPRVRIDMRATESRGRSVLGAAFDGVPLDNTTSSMSGREGRGRGGAGVARVGGWSREEWRMRNAVRRVPVRLRSAMRHRARPLGREGSPTRRRESGRTDRDSHRSIAPVRALRASALPSFRCAHRLPFARPRREVWRHVAHRTFDTCRNPAGISHRSPRRKLRSISNAITAAGIAPASSMAWSFSAKPVTMRSP